MAVYHVLKSGEVKTDITGHIVKMSDVPLLYETLRQIERRIPTNEKIS